MAGKYFYVDQELLQIYEQNALRFKQEYGYKLSFSMFVKMLIANYRKLEKKTKELEKALAEKCKNCQKNRR